jgi:hypothetical protein
MTKIRPAGAELFYGSGRIYVWTDIHLSLLANSQMHQLQHSQNASADWVQHLTPVYSQLVKVLKKVTNDIACFRG